MEKRLFLTGPAGSGKSRLIREALGGSLREAGGLVTQRSLDEAGNFLGFDLLPAAAAGGVSGYTPLRYLDCTVFPPAHDTEIFRGPGVRMLQEAGCYPFAVLDELGGFELIVPQFRGALEDLLNSDTPCVGAVRCREDMELLRGLLGLGERYVEHGQRLLDALRDDPDTCLLDLSDPGVDAADALRRWTVTYNPAV